MAQLQLLTHSSPSILESSDEPDPAFVGEDLPELDEPDASWLPLLEFDSESGVSITLDDEGFPVDDHDRELLGADVNVGD